MGDPITDYYGGDFDKETENLHHIHNIAKDFLERSNTGEINNVLLIVEDSDGFRLAHNEMEFTQAVGMTDIAKHILFHPEDIGEKDE